MKFSLKIPVFVIQTYGRTLEHGQYYLEYVPLTMMLYAINSEGKNPAIEKKLEIRVSRRFMKKIFKIRYILGELTQLDQWADQQYTQSFEHDKEAEKTMQQLHKRRAAKQKEHPEISYFGD